jgi:hypothetical protein
VNPGNAALQARKANIDEARSKVGSTFVGMRHRRAAMRLINNGARLIGHLLDFLR